MATTAAEIISRTPQAPTERTCRECGQPFALPDPELVSAYIVNLVHICPACCERDAKETTRQTIEKSKAIRLQRWQQLCPPEFLATEPNRLPCQRQFHAVIRWQFGPRGLILHGNTGKGKSRCAWLLLRREFEAGRSVRSLNSTSGLTYGAKFSESTGEVERWIERLCSVGILLLDDVFKAKLTDSFEAAVFSIINTRTERQLPVIATLNDTGDSLVQRLSPDRGAAMLRRLREFCEPISFT